MLTVADIETALRAKLPAEMQSDIPALATYLVSLVSRDAPPGEHPPPVTQRALTVLLQHLSGQSLVLDGHTIVFGNATAGSLDKREGVFISGGSTDSESIVGVNHGTIINVTVNAGQIAVHRAPFMAPALPEYFVPRPHEFEVIVQELCSPQPGPIAITGLRGAGGFGKTTLAIAVSHDLRTRTAFPDGVLWVTVGERPSQADIVSKIADLIERLTGVRPGFTSVEAATEMLAASLRDRRLVLVVDDVWDRIHLRPFLQGGERCARLVTTRMRDMLPLDARSVDVDAMSIDEASNLLLVGLSDTDASAPLFRALALRLGEWPVLLRLVNSALREQVALGLSYQEAFTYVSDGLTEQGLTAFDVTSASGRDAAVSSTLGVSLALLSDDEQVRFADLAVFPEDATIPLATLQRYWGATGSLSRFAVQQLSAKLFRLSLVVAYDARRGVRLHDVVRAYLIRRSAPALARLHQVLLDAHRPPSGAWADLPDDEPYLWRTLAEHLRDAGSLTELLATMSDPRYIIAKCWLYKTLAFESDAIIAQQALLDDATIRILERTMRQSGHLLDRCGDRSTLAQTLYSRVLGVNNLGALGGALKASLSCPALVPYYLLPDLPDAALRRTLLGHSAWLTACAVSEDGRTIVSTSYDGVVQIWDAVTGTLHTTLSGHTRRVSDCAMSADGSIVATASEDKTVRIWNARTGELRLTIPGHKGWGDRCALSADGRTLVSGTDGVVRVWDVATGVLRATFPKHTTRVTSCAVSADGHIVVSTSVDGEIRVWDMATGALHTTLTGHKSWVHDCAISADGQTIVAALSNGRLLVWNATTGTLRRTLSGHQQEVNGCAISSDGKVVVSASADRMLRVWDVTTGKLLATLAGHSESVVACAVSADHQTIISASYDKTVRVWDGTTRSPLVFTFGHTAPVTGCAISADGKTIVSASGDRTVRIWNGILGMPTAQLKGHTSEVRSCAVSADGTTIVSASWDKALWEETVCVWDGQNGSLQATLIGHTFGVNACAVNADGTLIASASDDKTVRLWDAKTGTAKATLVGHSDSVRSCAISPDGTYVVSASSDRTVRVWHAHSGALHKVLEGHTGVVRSCAVSSDGATIVSASDDQTVRIWDGRSGELRYLLEGHTDIVRGCAVNADGSLVVSVGDDQTVRVWDSSTGELLTMLYVDSALNGCACSSDGLRIAAAGKGGGVYVLRYIP